MTVPFQNVPANIRVPLFYAEVDNSKANTSTNNQRVLIIGQILSTGIAQPGIPLLSAGVSDAQLQGGVQSQLALMTAAYRKADSFSEVWYLPLADAASSVSATGAINIGTAPTASGTLNVYIGGVRYQLPVVSTQTTAQIATALAALINSDAACPVTALASGSAVSITADNKGTCGNEIDLRLNYLGSSAGEVTPAGMSVTFTPMSGGAIDPSLTAALANLGDETFDFIVSPYSDVTSLNALQAFLNDSTGRWSPLQQLYGHVFTAQRGTVGNLSTFGTGRNNQHETILGFYDSPTPAWLLAAQLAGSVAPALQNDPGRPVQSLPIIGFLAPPTASRFALTSRNTLLWDGISTFSVGSDGTCYVENLITTYQKNAFGSLDNSYLEIETMFLLAHVLRAMKTLVTSKYSRVKLAANGTRFTAGSAIVTPNIIKADLIAKYQELEDDGFVQNSAAFAQELIVEQNSTNPNRVDVLWPGTLIDQLRIFALLAQFRLS